MKTIEEQITDLLYYLELDKYYSISGLKGVDGNYLLALAELIKQLKTQNDV